MSKFVELNNAHINVDHINSFAWSRGLIIIQWNDQFNEGALKDPDRKLYYKLCHACGVEPAEVE